MELSAVSVSQRILDELLRLVGKECLQRDGKIYKESRRLTLGDFVLCDAALREMDLSVTNPDSPAILDDLIARSNAWPMALSAWRRGKDGNNIYFKMNRPAALKKALAENVRKKTPSSFSSSDGLTLVVCDLRSRSRYFTLSQLRCLYVCLAQKRLMRSRARLVIWLPRGFDAFDKEWANVSGATLLNETDFDVVADDAAVPPSGSALPEAEADTSAAVMREARRCAASIRDTMKCGEYGNILLFTSASREEVAKESMKLWTQLDAKRGLVFEVVPVGRVNPDEPVEDAWKKKRQIVGEITRERLCSVDIDVSVETVNLIALSSLKIDLLRKNVRSNVSLHKEERERRCDQKGGSFLQYNGARVCSLLRQFDDMVAGGTYPAFPVDGVDATLLTDAQEWELVFKYLCSDLDMLAEAAGRPENISRVVQWLMSFSLDFSSYYNRNHVLTDSREHLFPKMFARIQLLRKLRELLEFWLDIFGLPLLTDV